MNGLYVLNGAARARQEAAECWLLRAAQDERAALNEWADTGTAVLVAGHVWDAVRVPYRMLDPNLTRKATPDELRARVINRRLLGPVFCDPYRPYAYVLVPPGTDSWWPRAEFAAERVECLGGTEPYIHHVGVPRAGRAQPPGLFWVMSPDSVAHRHVDPAHLLDVLRQQLTVLREWQRAEAEAEAVAS